MYFDSIINKWKSAFYTLIWFFRLKHTFVFLERIEDISIKPLQCHFDCIILFVIRTKVLLCKQIISVPVPSSLKNQGDPLSNFFYFSQQTCGN